MITAVPLVKFESAYCSLNHRRCMNNLPLLYLYASGSYPDFCSPTMTQYQFNWQQNAVTILNLQVHQVLLL